MRKIYAVTGLAVMASLALPAAWSADPGAGQKLFQTTCIACHGQNGVGIAPMYPNLAGQKMEYIVAQLKAFRDGQRVNPIMSPMAKGLSDTDIANLAEYLSTLKPQ